MRAERAGAQDMTSEDECRFTAAAFGAYRQKGD